MNLFLLWQWL